jgi:hypothetical protein
MKYLVSRTILGLLLMQSLLWAQAGPKITTVEPETAKVGATLTVNGENLGKDTVVAFYFSDDAQDYKAEISEQNATKVVVKVPQLKAGPYNLSVQVGENIFIQPTRVTIE